MIEFKARLLIDSQDPELAYAMLRAAFRKTAIPIRLNDSWLVNNKPLPADSAQQIALAWKRSRATPDSGQVTFDTDDLAVTAELNQLDMFASGHIGIMHVTERAETRKCFVCDEYESRCVCEDSDHD